MNAFISAAPLRSSLSSSLGSASPSSCVCSRRVGVVGNPVVRRGSAMSTTSTRMVMGGGDEIHQAFRLVSENPGWLVKIADYFNSLGIPKPVTEYGHPIMMGALFLGMGVPGVVFGWQGRLNDNKKEGVGQKKLHENVMVAFYILAAFGGIGGTLATAMNGYDVWESPHALTSLIVLVLLGANSVVAYSGFTIGNDGTPKGRLEGRKLHSYFGVAVMVAFVVHISLGLAMLFE